MANEILSLIISNFISTFYGQDIQLKVLHFLKQNPSSIPFIRMGQIALFIKNAIFLELFSIIFGESTLMTQTLLIPLIQIRFPIKTENPLLDVYSL